MISADQLTFRHMETKDPTRITVFLSMDGTLADGRVIAGPWQSVEVELTEAELAVAIALKDRAKATLLERINAV
jgi:hypothetical protein